MSYFIRTGGRQLQRVNFARVALGQASEGSAAVASNWRPMIMAALIVWTSCGLVEARPAIAADMPTGTVQFSGGTVAAGIGYTWGNGTLTFQGKEYSFAVKGLSIVHVGAAGYTASGTVYNLTKLSDFDGVYTAVSAGAAIAGGATATSMKNDHGVLIQMVATQTGLNFQLGPHGVTITMK